MCNANHNPDPRGWHGRPGPAGRRRGLRSGCHPRPGNGARPAHFTRRTAPAGCPAAPAGHPATMLRGFTFTPAAAPATVPGPDGLVSTLLAAAQAHFDARDYATANAFLKLIPQPDTQPAATWQQLGQLHFALGEFEPAGRAYGYAAAYQPRDASLQVHLAHTCLRLDDIPSFEGYLQRALTLDPDSSPALQLLADLNRDEGRYADAASYYERLLAAAPGHYANLLSLSLCHAHLGDSEAAVGFLQRATQVARGTPSPATP